MRIISLILNGKWWWTFVLVILVCINWLASVSHFRIDLTNEKRFTLSEGTKKILRSLDAPVKIEVLLKGDYPSGFKRLSIETENLLQEFKELAGAKIQYSFKSPNDKFNGTSTTYADTLAALGIPSINLTSQIKEGQQQVMIYPVALVYFKDRMRPAFLYQPKINRVNINSAIIDYKDLNSAEAMLEYNIIDAVSKIAKEAKPTVGYAFGNGEPNPMGDEIADFRENVVGPKYNLIAIDPSVRADRLKDVSVLFVVKPTIPFTSMQKFYLDQYVMNGGKLIFFIDKLNAEEDSLRNKNEVIAYDRGLGLDDIFFRYGARINPDLIMDLQCDFLPFEVNGRGQYDFLPWNYFPVLESSNNHPINKNIGYVLGRFVNSIDTIDLPGIKKTVLLHSSVNARKIGTPALISGNENIMAPVSEKFRTANIPSALLLEGKFNSFYKNRLEVGMKDSAVLKFGSFKENCDMENQMIIVSDADIILNQTLRDQYLPMGTNKYTVGTERQFPFSNSEFLLNCIEYLLNDNSIIEAKSKDYQLYLLNSKKVESYKSFWQIINIIVPALIVVLFGVIYQFIRKRKYGLVYG